MCMESESLVCRLTMNDRGGVRDDERYRMIPHKSGRPHGLFYIINNKEFHPDTLMSTRTGTDVDASNLKALFSQIGYRVTLKHNQTSAGMLRLMEEGWFDLFSFYSI